MKSSYSDLITTLRSIHQSLFLTTTAILIAVVLAKTPENISSAQQELAIIDNMTSEANWNPLFLEGFYQEYDPYSDAMGEKVWHHQYWDIEFLAKAVYNNTEVDTNYFAGLIAPVDIFVGWDYSMAWDSDHFFWIGSGPVVERPNTIAELSQIWNKSKNISVLTVDHLKNYAYVQRSLDFPVEKISYDIKRTETYYARPDLGSSASFGVFRPSIFRSDDIAAEDRDLYGLSYVIEYDYLTNGKWKIWIPAVTHQGRVLGSLAQTSFDATTYLCEKMNMQKDRCEQPFEQVFPNLYNATRDYQKLPFQEVAVVLDQQAENQLQNFDLLGFKIPATLISGVGSVLLILLQIYFYLHLLNLPHTDVETYSPVWIGIFQDNISRALTVFSTAIFPLLIILILTLRNTIIDFVWPSWINIFISVISLYVSITLGNKLIFVWDLIDGQDIKSAARKKKSNYKKDRNL